MQVGKNNKKKGKGHLYEILFKFKCPYVVPGDPWIRWKPKQPHSELPKVYSDLKPWLYENP